jgi:hypothetical protein
MTLEERIQSIVYLHDVLLDLDSEDLQEVISRAYSENQWFTTENIKSSLYAISQNYFNSEALKEFTANYHLDNLIVSKKIGLVLAGNIPLVGIHDILCTYLVGHISMIKLSEKDKVLIPFLIHKLIEAYPDAKPYFQWVDKLSDYDAAIATGSNSTARHFEYYFRHVPHIIRQNRSSVAVITGQESHEQLLALGSDIFSYFGLGCRNVSKIYVPTEFDVTTLFVAWDSYGNVGNHNKYKNNFDYNVALYLLNKEKFLHNEFLMLKESESIVSRIGCIHYEYYNDLENLSIHLTAHQEEIQCVVSIIDLKGIETIKPGQAQCPTIKTYADGVDTIQFLLSI